MNYPILLTAFSLVALSACESQVPQTATPLSQAVVTTANVPMPVQDLKGGWNEGNFAYEQLRRKQSAKKQRRGLYNSPVRCIPSIRYGYHCSGQEKHNNTFLGRRNVVVLAKWGSVAETA